MPRDFPNPGDFPIPGVIYSYTEMLQHIGPHMVGDRVYPFDLWMIYGRFIVWPILGILALVVTGERFRAGIMIAIGHPLQSMLQPRRGWSANDPSRDGAIAKAAGPDQAWAALGYWWRQR